MQNQQKTDTAFSHQMSNMLNKTSQYLELGEEPVNDQHEQLLALQRRFALQPIESFVPGHIVQWKPGMKNKRIPEYGEPAIVMEVLNPPLLDADPEHSGSNYFREPLSLVLGIHDSDGDFMLFHYDGRRFESLTDQEAAR
jgi:hypothetical protein